MSLRGLIDGFRRQASLQHLPVPDFNFEEEEHRIFIVYLFAGLGDAALLAPVIQAINEQHPDIQIGVLLRPLAARTLKLFDLSVKIHTISEALLEHESDLPKRRPKVIRQEQEILTEELVRQAYTIGVDLSCRDGIEARIWLQRAQVYTSIGWIRDTAELERAELDFGTIDIRMHTDRHWVLANMLPFNSFLTPSPNPEIAWKIAPATKEKATLRWRKGKRVLVIPGSRDESKRWDVDAFAKVINHLCEQTDVSTMVSGGPSDTALVSTLVGKVSGPCSRFTGRDLKMLLGLVQSADLVITNDTGPMHLAFLSQIPTIAVFTYMNPTVWGPIWDSPDFAVYNLSSISPAEDFVDEIRDKALSMLGKTRD